MLLHFQFDFEKHRIHWWQMNRHSDKVQERGITKKEEAKCKYCQTREKKNSHVVIDINEYWNWNWYRRRKKVRGSTFMVYGYRLIYSRPLFSLLNLYLLIFASDVWSRCVLESIGFAAKFHHCHGKGATETQISFHPTNEFGQIISLLFLSLFVCIVHPSFAA